MRATRLQEGMSPGRKKLLLVIAAKAPLPGNVKTRLFPRLSPVEAAELYKCFLEDIVAEMRGLSGECDIAIAYTPEDAVSAFDYLSLDGFLLFAQKGNDLGERLTNIFWEKLSEGYEVVSVIGGDSPDLPKSIAAESFLLLSSGNSDVVFGPCNDGGYYLVALKKNCPEIFAGIPWSTGRVLSMSIKKAEKLGMRAAFLPPWNDIDTFEDMTRFFERNGDKSLRGSWPGVKTQFFLSGLQQPRYKERSK
jgi:rSAM/selenodomain-associated transferase 1